MCLAVRIAYLLEAQVVRPVRATRVYCLPRVLGMSSFVATTYSSTIRLMADVVWKGHELCI